MSLIIILFIVMLVIFSILWGNRTFSVKTLNQMIYHMVVPCDGTDEGIFKDWFLNCAPPAFLTTLIGVFLLYKTPLVFLFDYQGICITILILGTLLYALINYQIITYVFDMVRTSKLYEEHYVDPQNVELEFKEKRKIYKIHTYSAVEAMHENINDHIFRQLIWNKMYRKDVIKGIYFPTGKKIDDEFWTYQAIGNASKLIYMDQKLYAYRQQEQSVMHLLDAKKRLEALKAKEERHIYICEFMPQLKTESLNNLWFTCIYQGQRVLKDKNKENLKSVYPQIKRFIKKYPQTNLKDITDKKQKIWIIFAKISFCGTCKIRNLLKIGL